ncbi:hypothetical protein MBLNU230_g5322t1 [Neophaeotheca triangularis]
MRFPTALTASLFLATTSTATEAPKPKIIIENDFNSDAYLTFLLAIDAGWEVLGLVGNTANSWSRQASYHALSLLEIGGLSCIPVHKGADYPLLNTPELHRTWETLNGQLPYQGVFAPLNTTAEALGTDPTSGDPSRIVPEAFIQGYPNTTLAGEQAARWMIDQVHAFPHQVTIFSGGSLTNVALAVRMDPEFASLTKGLVQMGGYIDVMLLRLEGGEGLVDINSDINLKVDPEAAKIALTADFPNITLVGNGANQLQPTQDFKTTLSSTNSSYPYTTLFAENYPSNLPYWDPLAIFPVLQPSKITNSTSFHVTVDTAWNSPYYGNIMAYSATNQSRAQNLRPVQYVRQVEAAAFEQAVARALVCEACAGYCSGGAGAGA